MNKIMNLVDVQLKDLIKPDKFPLTSEDDLFDRLVNVVNTALENEADNGDEIYETSDAHVEIFLDANDDFSDTVTSEMVAALEALYQQVGWQKVTHEHQEETEDNYEGHIFKFYFKHKVIPGISSPIDSLKL
jgi:hypothetical protein